METSSLIRRTSKGSKSRMKNYHHSLKNHCLKTRKNINKNNNHHSQNGEHHNHYNLTAHYRNRHISTRVNFPKHGKIQHVKLNGNGTFNGNHGVASRKLEVKYGKNRSTNNADHLMKETPMVNASGYDGKAYSGENATEKEDLTYKDELLIGNFTR